MEEHLSAAKALQLLFHSLGGPRNNSDTVAKTICSAVQIKRDSVEFHYLMYSVSRNFSELGMQLDHASEIGDGAKAQFRNDLTPLSTITNIDKLRERYDEFYKSVILPHVRVLTYADDALKCWSVLPKSEREQFASIIQALEAAVQELHSLSDDAIPIAARATFIAHLQRLIFVLKNYEKVGFEAAWEAASSAYTTLCRDAAKAETKEAKSTLTKVAQAAGLTLVILAGVAEGTTHFSKIATNTVDTLKRIRDGNDLIKDWMEEATPKLEDHSKNNKNDVPL
jgi:hypothetical protein